MTTYLSVAITLPKSIKKELKRLCFGLPDVVWKDEEDFHLTLLHTGPNEGALEIDVHEKLVEVDFSPFTISIQGVNCFKSKDSKGTLWAGVQESKELEAILRSVNSKIKELMLPKNSGGLTAPHITLGRYDKVDGRRLSEYMEGQAHFVSAPFLVEYFVLLESRKSRDNTTLYTEIGRYPVIPPRKALLPKSPLSY